MDPDTGDRCQTARKPFWLRWLCGTAGLLCVGLAFLGVFLPGLPTTPFLLLAGFFFSRSFPELGQRLMEKPIFRPYRPYVDGSRPIPRRAKIAATGAMWLMIAFSLFIFSRTNQLVLWLWILMISSGFAGTWMVWFWLDRRNRRKMRENRMSQCELNT